MPAKYIVALGFVLISFCSAAQVSANWFTGFFKDAAQDTKRRNCWPEPFLGPDRAAVHAPFCTMVSNGWRKQNLLGEYHFQPDTGELTEAGRNKVRWILTVCPEQHRLVYIHNAATKKETAARRKAVEQLIAQLAPENPPPVLTTSIPDEGWSAQQADLIGREYQKSIPKPRLPDASSQSGGSGSGN